MTSYVVEVSDRFEGAVPCRDLVYSSVPEDCRIRENRVYEIQGDGDLEAFKSFVNDVLVDDVSQNWKLLEDPSEAARTDFDHRLDVWLKSSVLDLEEDYLLDYCEDHRDLTGYQVESIRILTRYYVTLNGADDSVVKTIVRDLANPVIHEWNVKEHA